ncbi:MAG: PH domain-containing protein [Marinilabiliaceae bacterium]|jgi:hypothetical protein|nr:PH domain-containing protein [Marinilabiliaceae bacterium]
MKFGSKKDILISVLFAVINAFLIWILISGLAAGKTERNEYWALALVLAVVALLFWFYFGTSYRLSEEEGLVYRSGPFHGKISLHRITEIVEGKTPWVGFRPATSRRGLLIKYDKYNEIYISPKSNEDFITKILELKSEIKITRI